MTTHLLARVAAVTTALAVVPALSAQAQDAEGQAAQATPIDITTWDYSQLYDGWSVETLLDAEVHDEDGEQIGEVENLIVTPDGEIQSLVIEAGGFLDLGDAHFTYPWQDAEIVSLDRVEVDFDEDAIEDYSLFGDIEGEPVIGRGWRITQLIDDYAFLGGRVPYGWVDDVIINAQGEIEAVVVYPDVTYGVYAPYAWPYYGYAFEPGLAYYEVPYTLDEVAELESFDYDQMRDKATAEAGGQAEDKEQTEDQGQSAQ